MNDYFRDLLSHFGGGAKLAKALGVTEATVSRWKHGQQLPVDQAKRIEDITDGKFTAIRLLQLDRKAA